MRETIAGDKYCTTCVFLEISSYLVCRRSCHNTATCTALQWQTLVLFAGQMYSNQTVGFLLQKLDVAQEKVRVPTLEVLKHVINSCGMLDMLACGCIHYAHG